MIPLIIAVASVGSMVIEWYYAQQNEAYLSQIEYLLSGLQQGMSFEDFLMNCWLIIIVIIAYFFLLLWIAFPKRKRRLYS